MNYTDHLYQLGIRGRKKSKRGKNFSSNERTLFLNVIKNHLEIIESKNTDTETLKRKSHTWQKISDEFNLLTQENGYRDPFSLKTLYCNIKRRKRRQLRKEPHLEEEYDSSNSLNLNGFTPVIPKLELSSPPDYEEFEEECNDIKLPLDNIEDTQLVNGTEGIEYQKIKPQLRIISLNQCSSDMLNKKILYSRLKSINAERDNRQKLFKLDYRLKQLEIIKMKLEIAKLRKDSANKC